MEETWLRFLFVCAEGREKDVLCGKRGRARVEEKRKKRRGSSARVFIVITGTILQKRKPCVLRWHKIGRERGTKGVWCEHMFTVCA
jgi:hypothetical protein